MKQVDMKTIRTMARENKESLWELAQGVGREPRLFLHWSAGHYGSFFEDYHINIDADGSIYISTEDLSERLAHTWHQNTGTIGIALACCYNATTNDLGTGRVEGFHNITVTANPHRTVLAVLPHTALHRSHSLRYNET